MQKNSISQLSGKIIAYFFGMEPEQGVGEYDKRRQDA